MNLEHIVQTYGYAAVLLGTLMEGETILILGAFAAYQGYLAFPWVVVCAFCGAFCGDQLFFFLGRRWSGVILDRFPTWRERMVKVHLFLDRFQTWAVLIYRFMYGFRSITPFVLGSGSIPVFRWVSLNLIAVAAWAVSIGFLGYLFAGALHSLLGNLKKFEISIAALIAVLGFSVWYFVLRREQKKNRPPPP